MTNQPPELRVLAPEGFQHALSRRAFLKFGTAAAGAAFLAACSNDSAPKDSVAVGATDSATQGTTAAPVSAGSILGDYSNVINKATGTLAMFTWGDYNDPGIVGALATEQVGVKMKVDFYPSNEDLITKLAAGNGTSGYDIVVPTGAYLPQMVQKGLLQKLDKSLLPNMANIDPLYLKQDFDPTNDYTVCKNWGSTGWIWNTKEITRDIATWADFIDVAMKEASGKTSVIDTPVNLAGMYFWANGIDWNTEKAEELDAYEKFIVNDFSQHVKAFDSYPSTKIAEGAYTLAMAWNGDARQTFTRIKDAGGNPEDWKWALGAPDTEIWMDNYSIPAGAPNVEAAHAWINWVLSPEISIKDLQYHGYNSGMKNMSALLAEIAPDLTRGDMIFFKDEQVKTMRTNIVNSSQDRKVDILNKAKAKAAS